MSASEILPAPEITLPVPSKFERERWEFYKQLAELLKTYEGEYVAIHEGRVVGHGADQAEVALDAYNRIGYVPIYVGQVTADPPRPARIPSPRRRRRKLRCIYLLKHSHSDGSRLSG